MEEYAAFFLYTTKLLPAYICTYREFRAVCLELFGVTGREGGVCERFEERITSITCEVKVAALL